MLSRCVTTTRFRPETAMPFGKHSLHGNPILPPSFFMSAVSFPVTIVDAWGQGGPFPQRIGFKQRIFEEKMNEAVRRTASPVSHRCSSRSYIIRPRSHHVFFFLEDDREESSTGVRFSC